VDVRFTVLSGGASVFTETHSGISTNGFGLINLKIGTQNTTDFGMIDWTSGTKALQIEVDAGNGFDYKKGAYQLTIFNTNDSGSELTIDVSRKGSYSKAVDKFNFQIHGISAEPKSVTADGKTVKFDFNQDKSQLIFTTSSEISKVNILKK
jgi:hypothetical protein